MKRRKETDEWEKQNAEKQRGAGGLTEEKRWRDGNDILWWIVERTFSWFGWYRRQNTDYERYTHTAEVIVYIAMIRLILKRITYFIKQVLKSELRLLKIQHC